MDLLFCGDNFVVAVRFALFLCAVWATIVDANREGVINFVEGLIRG